MFYYSVSRQSYLSGLKFSVLIESEEIRFLSILEKHPLLLSLQILSLPLIFFYLSPETSSCWTSLSKMFFFVLVAFEVIFGFYLLVKIDLISYIIFPY